MAQALSSSDIASVVVGVTAADMPTRTASLVKTNGQWSGILGNLPAGTLRTFTAEAFNGSGTKLYAGTATHVTILAQQTTAVSITLQEVNPAAPFENAAPWIASLSAAPGTVGPGGTVSLQAAALDANPSDTLTYSWSAPSGSFAQAGSLSTTWTAPTSAATVPLTLTVTDSKGAQGKVTFNVTVTTGKGDATVNASINTWPRVDNISASVTALEVNESTTVTATASDSDGDSLTYNWAASCPGTWTGAHSATAQFTATAQPSSSACNNCTLTVTVTDSRDGQPVGGQTTGTFSLCVGPRKTATFPPDITETFQSATSTSAHGTVTFRLKAVDPQGSALGFSWAASAGTPGTPTSSANTSEVAWTAPACVPAAPPTITATVTNALGGVSTHSFTVTGLPACVNSGWVSTAAMVSARYGHTTTLLPGGKVLVAGGQNNAIRSTTEVYDLTSGSWSAGASMASSRTQYAAALLNGRALVLGGISSGGAVLAATELYDPASGSWSAAAAMTSARARQTVTRLPDGRLLVTGGYNANGALATAELYSSATGTWTAARSMASPRESHTATLLDNGKVLVTGGINGSTHLATTELYDPVSNTWSAAGSMASARGEHTATLLNNGKVLVTGGLNGTTPLASVELYDPASNTWSAASSMSSSRYQHTATLLHSGKVLVAGGFNGGNIAAAELYDRASGAWSATQPMASSRRISTATLLPDGRVFVVGGFNGNPLTAAELYTP
ncbi:kelch repeat-containing protein [Corallococcus sp. CA054B]|uniref:Kelch repeat-containing protein n=1 Tax=Corallococcus sp. CA054B TaxID=2316734 RepID=UPI001F2BF0B4|nr:kelch repeat-containing protein [Corallococcus sp. CA054B]